MVRPSKGQILACLPGVLSSIPATSQFFFHDNFPIIKLVGVSALRKENKMEIPEAISGFNKQPGEKNHHRENRE